MEAQTFMSSTTYSTATSSLICSTYSPIGIETSYILNKTSGTQKNAASLKSTKFESESNPSNISSDNRALSLNHSTLESAKVESDSDYLPKDTTYTDSANCSSDEEEKVEFKV